MSHYGPGPAGTTKHRGAPGDCADLNCAPPRTAAATAARRRQGEERAATMLRERGWLAIPPEHVQTVRYAATYHPQLDDVPGLELGRRG